MEEGGGRIEVGRGTGGGGSGGEGLGGEGRGEAIWGPWVSQEGGDAALSVPRIVPG